MRLPTPSGTDPFRRLSAPGSRRTERGALGQVLAPVRDAEVFYRFSLRAPWGHSALVVLLAGVMWFLGPRIWRNYHAERLATAPTFDSIKEAIALSPDRAEFRNVQGGLYLDSTVSYDPARAVDSFRRAVDLNPAVAAYWLNLAHAYDAMGKPKESEQCIRSALDHDPRNPELTWSSGNIHASAGDIAGALKAWHESIQDDPVNTAIAIDSGWNLSGDTQAMLDQLMPPGIGAHYMLLEYLVRKNVGDPELVWKSILAHGDPIDVRRVGPYFALLLRQRPDIAGWKRDIQRARQAWNELIKRGTVASPAGADETAGGENLIQDGGFEHEFPNIGFGWRWDPPGNITLVMDHDAYQEGRRSARLDFEGLENTTLRHLTQIVPVEAMHRYLLTAQVRAEKITGGSGLRIAVRGVNADGPGLVVLGREVFETGGAWIQERLDFVVPPNTPLVAVMADREPSRKFSPNIGGSFWLDDIVLRDMTVWGTIRSETARSQTARSQTARSQTARSQTR